MPTVVRIATTEQTTMKTDSARSTPLRARKRGARRRAGEEEAERAWRRRRPRTSRAGRWRSSGSAARRRRRPPGSARRRCGRRRRCGSRRGAGSICDAAAPAVRLSGRLRTSRPSMTVPWKQQPEQHEDQRRHADPDRDEGAVVARQRVHRLAVGGDEAARRASGRRCRRRATARGWSGRDSRTPRGPFGADRPRGARRGPRIGSVEAVHLGAGVDRGAHRLALRVRRAGSGRARAGSRPGRSSPRRRTRSRNSSRPGITPRWAFLT